MENEDNKQLSKKITIDSDMALAIALQQQETQLVNLMGSEISDSDDDIGSISSCDQSFDSDQHAHSNYVNLDELEDEDESDYQDMEEDEVDPDEMSYEELLALGEIVGSESKGLSHAELKYYLHSYTFKRHSNCKDGLDRCVICQFEYEEEEAVAALGCQHAYHSDCITKWLQINKVCPICNIEVSSSSSQPVTDIAS